MMTVIIVIIVSGANPKKPSNYNYLLNKTK
ncbi:hypothetical protein AEQU1_01834 [Aequorivita sp. CIP111184]|nr:hypothetical protein AEQU1_01834 [Aequorivita sp. CIP111184]